MTVAMRESSGRQKFAASSKRKKYHCFGERMNKWIWQVVGFRGTIGGPFELGGKELTAVPTCLVEPLPPAGLTSSGAGTKITGSTSKAFDGQVD